MLRLLEKKEVDKLKAEEQRLKIDEGKRLAKRVDNLRELSVDTEASYKSYRDTAIKEIQAEIDVKILEKNELEAVLPALRKERERLENPPDLTEAWEKVSRETEQNVFLRETLDSKEESLKSESNRLIKLEKEIAERDEIVEGREKMLAQDWKETEQKKEQARQTLLEAGNKLRDMIEDEKVRRSVLEQKEAHIANKERVLELREASLNEREKEITSQTKFLADQRETLKRAITRQENGR